MATFTGTAGSDVANAADGTLTGFAGGSVTELQDGTGDTFNGLGGDDTITAGAGDDTLNGGNDNDLFNGGDGDDQLQGGAGDDTLLGGSGDDSLSGGAGFGFLNGDDGNDTLLGGGQWMTFNGGAGNDRLDATNGSGTAYYGGELGPVAVNLAAGVATDGSGGQDTLLNIGYVVGSAFDDTLMGYGPAAAAGLEGGQGNDFLSDGILFYSADIAGVNVDLAAGQATDGWGDHDTLWNVHHVFGSAHGDTLLGSSNFDHLLGESGNDFISGGGGDDTLIGGEGNDTLNGGAGADSLIGDAGDDVFNVYNVQAGDAFDGGAGSDTLQVLPTDVGFSVSFIYETRIIPRGPNLAPIVIQMPIPVTVGGSTSVVDFRPVGLGFTSIETLVLHDGSWSNGRAVSQSATVTFDASQLTGGAGALPLDLQVVGDFGREIINVFMSTPDLVDLSGWTFSSWSAATDLIVLTGTGGTDSIIGSSQSDRITGAGGLDVLDGQGGDDLIVYDAMDSSISGGTGVDTLLVTSPETINLSAADQTAGDVANVSGFENVQASPSIGAVTLIGSGSDNILYGGSGNDTISGGAGNDSLIGGPGNDVFAFGSGFGSDTVSGFDANAASGQDLLNVSALGITGGTFNGQVSIADLGNDTLVTIAGGGTILLLGVDGAGQNAITQSDFILA